MTNTNLDAGFSWLESEHRFATSLGLPDDVTDCPPELREPHGLDTSPPTDVSQRAFAAPLAFRESLLAAKAAGYQLRGLLEVEGLALGSSLRLVVGDAAEPTPVAVMPVLTDTGLLRLDIDATVTVPLVPFATRADGFAVLVPAAGASRLVAVPAGAVQVGQPGTMYDDGTADVTFTVRSIAAGRSVADVDDGQVERLVAGLYLHRAAVAVGGARAAITLARDSTVERQAFGRSIAVFQTVQHVLANAHADVEGAELLLQAASSELMNSGADCAPLAREAATYAAVTYRMTSDQCLHLHGGRGFLKTSAIEAYFRHAKQHELREGGPHADVDVLSEYFLLTDGYVPANLMIAPE